MNLRITKSNGRQYLSIGHNYREKDTKKVKTKTIKSLGYLDDLKKTYPDPVAHFKAAVAQMNEEAAQNKLTQMVRINQTILLEKNACARKNIGYMALSRIYHELGLHIFVNNRSRALNASYPLHD